MHNKYKNVHKNIDNTIHIQFFLSIDTVKKQKYDDTKYVVKHLKL